MPYDYAQSRFSAADLKDKSVYVRIPLERGGVYEGEAKFDAVQDHRGFIRVAVIYYWWDKDMSACNAAKVFVPSGDFSKILRNPAGSKCEFNFIAS
jgi:hypothetical protein